MRPRLRVLDWVTFPLIAFGFAFIIYRLIQLYLVLDGSRTDAAVGIDDVAASTSAALKAVVLGILLIVGAFIARHIVLRRARKAG